jgi:hypothetical protein
MILLKPFLTTLTLAGLLVTLQLVEAAPTKLRKRALNASAPLASDINGAHLLLLNDVDSSKGKNAFLLLSKPRGYYDGMSACDSMGDGNVVKNVLLARKHQYANHVFVRLSDTSHCAQCATKMYRRIHLYLWHGRCFRSDHSLE